MADAHKNFAVGTISVPPSPATTGTSLTLQAGQGALYPAVSFNATVWPAGVQPTAANAEIVRVTNIATDTFTITRIQESSSARTIVAGDQIEAGVTAKTLTDTETSSGTWVPVIGGSGGTSGQTYSSQNGYYTKNGKQVFVQCGITLTAKGTITGTVQLQGLPFTVENLTAGFSLGPVSWGALNTSWVSIVALASPNTTVALMRGATAAAIANQTDLVTGDLTNASTFIISLSYRTP